MSSEVAPGRADSGAAVDSGDGAASTDLLTRLHTRVPWLLPLVIGVLAFAARIAPLLRGPAGLRSAGLYDDATYYSASAGLLGGRVPYRDFLFLHPPGIMLLGAPFTAFGRFTSDLAGMEAARLGVMVIGAVNAVLVYHVAKRVGLFAGLFAGLVYAFWLPAVWNGNNFLLEPFVDLGLVAGLLLLGDAAVQTRTRVVLAGVALGGACSVKVWGVLPAVVLLAWVWNRGGPRRAAYFAAGVVGTVVVACGPFFALAPADMFRMVVVDQAQRTHNGVDPLARIGSIVGLRTTVMVHPSFLYASSAIALAVLAAAAAVAVAWKVHASRVWVALLVVQAATLGLVGTYFNHYADFIAVPLALVAGACAGLIVTSVTRSASSAGPAAPARRRGLASALLLLLVVPSAVIPFNRDEGTPFPSAWLRRHLGSARCVTSDNPMTLIQGNVLTRSLDHGCRVEVDPTGLAYDLRGHPLPAGMNADARRRDPAWQGAFLEYALTGDRFVLDSVTISGLNESTLEVLRGYPRVSKRGGREVIDVRTAN